MCRVKVASLCVWVEDKKLSKPYIIHFVIFVHKLWGREEQDEAKELYYSATGHYHGPYLDPLDADRLLRLRRFLMMGDLERDRDLERERDRL